MEVNNDRLDWALEEDVLINQPYFKVNKSGHTMVFMFHKALHGLKQTPKAWFDKPEDFLWSLGLTKSITICFS